MKNYKFISFQIFFPLYLILTSPTSLAYAQAIPTITIRTAPIFDSVCSTKTNYNIEPKWRKELDEQLPKIKKVWNHLGTKLLTTTIELVGVKFDFKNYIANLSLCSFPSMSEPLLINARYVLNSFTDTPITQDVLIGVIYHELLHGYLNGHIPESSQMLKKYRNESLGVKHHIHLLALMKTVYLKLGWQRQLTAIQERDNTLPNKDYKVAWEIVNAGDNASLLIREIKTHKFY